MGFKTQDDNLYVFAFVHFRPGEYDGWQAAYDELAKYVWAEEPTTLTYYFGVPYDFADDISSTSLLFAFEVYDKRASLYNVHFTSPVMQNVFIPRGTAAMTTGFDLQHYSRVAGFLDLAGNGKPCGVLYDIKIECASSEARGRVVVRLQDSVAPAIEASPLADPKDGPRIQTWTAFASQDNDTDARILARFCDKAALQAYFRLPAVLEFWAAGKDTDVKRVEQRGYVENGKGWLHR